MDLPWWVWMKFLFHLIANLELFWRSTTWISTANWIYIDYHALTKIRKWCTWCKLVVPWWLHWKHSCSALDVWFISVNICHSLIVIERNISWPNFSVYGIRIWGTPIFMVVLSRSKSSLLCKFSNTDATYLQHRYIIEFLLHTFT